MGESKDGEPHGKGMCYFKEADKIIFGNFNEGKAEGNCQLYFLNGDYFLG